MIARTYRVFVDVDQETEAREAMEARDVEGLLDEITRREIHRLLEAEAAMVEAAPVPAAWIGQRRVA